MTMTSNAVFFVGVLLVLLLVWMSISLRNVNWKDYFSTKTGKGILKGIVLALLVAIIIALASSAFAEERWFKEASFFAGLDYTQKLSPMCEQNTVDDRTTSNLGFRLNVYDRGPVSIRSKYTHHSCAFGADDSSYDALGAEIEYTFWRR